MSTWNCNELVENGEDLQSSANDISKDLKSCICDIILEITKMINM